MVSAHPAPVSVLSVLKKEKKAAVFVGSVHVMLTNVQRWGLRYFCPNKYEKKKKSIVIILMGCNKSLEKA